MNSIPLEISDESISLEQYFESDNVSLQKHKKN